MKKILLISALSLAMFTLTACGEKTNSSETTTPTAKAAKCGDAKKETTKKTSSDGKCGEGKCGNTPKP